jgi:hypothetical protein
MQLTKDYLPFLSCAERNIRRYWLILLCINLFIPWVTVFGGFAASKGLSVGFALSVSLAFIFLPVLISYFLYRSAYRKPGTKWLVGIVMAAPLHLGFELYGFLTEPVNAMAIAMFFADFALPMGWYFLCYALRAINLKIRVSATHSPLILP